MLKQEAYETILIDRQDNGIVVATLNRPERLNAVNKQMHTELSRISLDANDDDSVRVLVLTGAGRSFCAGGDFSGDSDVMTGRRQSNAEALSILTNMLDCRIPIISAVNGYAMGLGASVSLLSDIVVAGRSTVFADTHVNMGIGAGDGGQLIWPLLMGVNRAKYHLMTGERVTGDDAMEMGLVNFVVEDDQILPKAMEVAERLAKGPGLAIEASKVGVNQYIKMVCNLVMPVAFAEEMATFRSEDAAEAAKAFQEKREPNFRNR
jgi:enoyl-CoA hydratase